MSRVEPSWPKPLIVVGAGGLGTEYAWVAECMNDAAGADPRSHPWKLLGYADDAPAKRNLSIGNRNVLGNIAESGRSLASKEIYFSVAVGDNGARARLAAEALQLGWHPAILIHPSAIVARDAHIAPGTYIAPGCVICPNARIGAHAIVNTHASVGHDSVVEDFAQLCPGARISGGCHIEAHAFIGSNASLSPGVCVGMGAVVGANSHAVWKVSAGDTVVGNPAIAARGLRTERATDRR